MVRMTAGTPKQVAWAEKIASDYLASFDRLGVVGDSDSNDDRIGRSLIKALRLRPATSPAEIRETAVWLQEQTDATWWIDRRDHGVEGLIAIRRGRPEDCQYPLTAQ